MCHAYMVFQLNFATNNEIKATRLALSLLSFQMPICSESVCNGSVMMPNLHARKPDEVRSKEELLKLATDFIDQYYTSIKRQAQPLASARLNMRLEPNNVFYPLPLLVWDFMIQHL